MFNHNQTKITHLVSDFDGVYNDLSVESINYLYEYLNSFAAALKIPLAPLAKLADDLRLEIVGNNAEPMLVNGYKVCRANVTPYDVNRAVFTKIFNLLKSGQASFPADKAALDAIEGYSDFLHEFHKKGCDKVHLSYYPQAAELLRDLSQSFQMSITTSSGEAHIKQRLNALQLENISVLGEIRKYQIDKEATDLPESFSMAGLDRPVLLRRASYLNGLNQLKDLGYAPSRTAVIGDVFENDLALPWYLGYQVVLFDPEDKTPDYEKQFFKDKVKRGGIARSYEEMRVLLNQ